MYYIRVTRLYPQKWFQLKYKYHWIKPVSPPCINNILWCLPFRFIQSLNYHMTQNGIISLLFQLQTSDCLMMRPSVLSSNCSSFWLNKDSDHEAEQQGRVRLHQQRMTVRFGGAMRVGKWWHTYQVWWGQWAVCSDMQHVSILEAMTSPAVCRVKHTGQHPFVTEKSLRFKKNKTQNCDHYMQETSSFNSSHYKPQLPL